MSESDVTNLDAVLERIRAQVKTESIRITQHASKKWRKRTLHSITYVSLLLQDRFWKTTLSTAEGHVACSTALLRMADLCTLFAQQRNLCLLSLRYMNPNRQSG